jgi:hypothetical protein
MEAGYFQQVKILMSAACYHCYFSFSEQFATLQNQQLWLENNVAHPELHKSL